MSGTTAVLASAVQTIYGELQTRAQLQSQLAKVAKATSIQDLLVILANLPLAGQALTLAQQQMTTFLQQAIAQIEAQITAQGVTLDV
jgi:hypothetical protein